MKIIQLLVMIFWSIILGQLLGFICAALTNTIYNPLSMLIVSIIFAFLTFIIALLMNKMNISDSTNRKY